LYLDEYEGRFYVQMFQWMDYLYPYMKMGVGAYDNPAWRCPASNAPKDTWAVAGYSISPPSDVRGAYGYAFNAELNYVFGPNPRLSDIVQPSRKAFAFDAATPQIYASTVINEDDPFGRHLAYRHIGGCNVLLFDGHVEWMRRADLRGNKDFLLWPHVN
jgi:prepilin-type processing-associated H-X9-DG protein